MTGRDTLGWRRVFAVFGPSTNTVVEPEFAAMRPAGVTHQYRDIYIENAKALPTSTTNMTGLRTMRRGSSFENASTMAPFTMARSKRGRLWLGGCAMEVSFSAPTAGGARRRGRARAPE